MDSYNFYSEAHNQMVLRDWTVPTTTIIIIIIIIITIIIIIIIIKPVVSPTGLLIPLSGKLLVACEYWHLVMIGEITINYQ